MDHDELMELLEHGGTRQRVIRVLGGTVNDGGIVYQRETVETEDPTGITTVEWSETRRCSCGHVIDQNTSLAGVCAVCGRAVCSAEGCAHRCQRCGMLLCRRHARVYGTNKDQVYCRRHAFIYWLKKIFM
jgi:hypothetical protein